MPPHSWDDLYKAIRKGPVPATVYLYGSEDPLKDEAIQELLDRTLDPGLRDFNLDTRSAATLDPDDVSTLLTTLPMMADRRMVILRDVESWNKRAKAKQAVLRAMEKPSPETLLVLVQGAGEPEPDADLAKRSYSVHCDRLPPDRAGRWLVKEAGRVGVTLSDLAVEHLVRALDASLGDLRAEIGKLAGMAGTEPLSVEQVSQLLGVRHGETQFDWRDAVMEGRAGLAATMLPTLLAQSGVTGVKLITLVGQALVGTALACALRDDGKRGRALEAALFDALKQARLWGIDYRTTAALWARWSDRWTTDSITAAITAAIEADQALKNTTISDPGGLLTDFALRLAVPLREAA